jgi:hypothetical protein
MAQSIRHFILGTTLLAGLPLHTALAAEQGDANALRAVEDQWSLIDSYCVDCHNTEDWAGSLALDTLTTNDIAANAATFESAIRKLRGRLMPPPGNDRPAESTINSFVASMEGYIDSLAASHSGNPGHIAVHRLNRKEYANAVRDLFGVEVDAASLLPADASVEGFDNVAEALRASPTFLEQSLTASRVVAALAVGNPSPRPGGATYNATGNQYSHIAGLPLGTRGGLVVEHYFPADGEYVLNIGNLAAALWVTNQEFTHTLIATLDGVKFFEMDIGGGKDLQAIDQIGDPAVRHRGTIGGSIGVQHGDATCVTG